MLRQRMKEPCMVGVTGTKLQYDLTESEETMKVAALNEDLHFFLSNMKRVSINPSSHLLIV